MRPGPYNRAFALLALAAACAHDSAAPPADTMPDTAASPGTVAVTLGTPELVMRYRTQSCEAWDLPDTQARAFRRADGTVVLVSGNAPRNYWMQGPDFTALARVCRPVLSSGDDPRPETFDNQEWIVATYREAAGDIVHALVHNEYHDPFAPNCRPGDTSPANPCWYNAITYAASADGGRTFRQAASPAHVVAAPPGRWDPAVARGAPGPYGYFSPSNIVRGADSAWYALFFAIPHRDRPTERGACVMRTDDLASPGRWLGWDGAAFSLRMASPYHATGAPACAFVSRPEIGDLHGSLVYSTYLRRYVLVGATAVANGSAVTCGFFFAMSRDLIHWTPRQLLKSGKLPFPQCTAAGPEGSDLYPSLIDHADASLNFEVAGRQPYLYYVRWNQGLDRDLWRVRLTFALQ